MLAKTVNVEYQNPKFEMSNTKAQNSK